MKFEYMVMNASDVDRANTENIKLHGKAPRKITWLDQLNFLGAQGWEFTGHMPTAGSWLMKKAFDVPSDEEVGGGML